jgi:hypothetical protein
MRFSIEGGSAGVNGLDVVAKTGATGRVWVEEIRVDVTDGNGLQVDCYRGSGDDVFVSGIEVLAGLPDYYVNVTSPSPGSTHRVGETVDVRWEAGAKIGGVVIEASFDGGITWQQLIQGGDIAPGHEHWLSYPWVIPAQINGVSTESDKVLVKVYDYQEMDAMDMTPGLFAIAPGESAARLMPGSQVRTTRIDMAAGLLQVRAARPGRWPVTVFRLDGRAIQRTSTGPDGILRAASRDWGEGAVIVRLKHGTGALSRLVTTGM